MPSHFITKNFIGRNRELEVLKNIHLEAKSGDATGMFLSGRNGIGKTELLRQAFNHYSNNQENAIPFYYTIKTSVTSIENFSRDYFCSFIVQCLAFLKKDISMIDACIYSVEDIMQLAKESGIQWVADIADNYEKAKKDMDPLNLFLTTVSAPYQSYLLTGMPVIVMIDDFHKIGKFCEINAIGSNKDYWMLFETSVKSRHTPHIFTGNQAELDKMFFEDTLFGEYLELFNISGLVHDDSVKYFTMLCETYGLDVRIDLFDFIELFGGSPYYIKNFVQAARQSSMVLSEENFWLIYLSEITKGKTFKYWTSLLKTYISKFELRKPSLRFLYHLCKSTSIAALGDLSDEISVSQEDTGQIIELLHTSGVVEIGFSEIEVADDRILIDIIKGLYLKEIRLEPWNSIKEGLISEKRQRVTTVKIPSFSLSVPADAKAEYVAVKTIEHVAQNYNISSGIIGQIQIALADLFANVIGGSGKGVENYFLKFILKENNFYVEITVPDINVVLENDDRERIGTYLDGLTVESIAGGTKITLLKGINRDVVSTSH